MEKYDKTGGDYATEAGKERENRVKWDLLGKLMFHFCEVFERIVQQKQKNGKKKEEVCAHLCIAVCYTNMRKPQYII